jgi:hypothetical protein
MSSCHLLALGLTDLEFMSIASRTGDGRDATSRPNVDVDGDACEGEDATAAEAAVLQAVVPVAVQPAIQAAPCRDLEPPA